MTLGPTSVPISSVLLGLLLFGLAFNWLVATMEHRRIDGWTWAQVAVGVGVTVMTSGLLIGWTAVLLVLACMAASGTPMIVGAIVRHRRRVGKYLTRLWRLTGLNADTDASADGQ